MTALSTVTPRLSRLLPLLGSDKDGEVVATARAIGRTLASAGTDWHALAAAVERPPVVVTAAPAAPREPYRRPKAGPINVELLRVATWCDEYVHVLGAKDRSFVASMVTFLSRGGRPSDKQRKWLQDIAQRLRTAGAG